MQLLILTINDALSDFYRLFRLGQQMALAPPGERIEFDFSQCGFLRQNAVAMIGGMVRLAEHRGHPTSVLLEGASSWLRTNLYQNGFAHAFGVGSSPWKGNSVPYRQDRELNKEGFLEYLREDWLGRNWLNVSEGLRDAICGQVWEVYQNAFDHSESPIGITACGQHYPRNGELKLTLADFGIGIPARVRRYLGDEAMTASEALRWAFSRGHTTRTGTFDADLARGIGLDLLREFVRKNRGRIEVYSHDACLFVDERQERYMQPFGTGATGLPKVTFLGTVVNITFSCDETLYILSNESAGRPYF